jgi:small-conductance mechanosensitive channel
MVEESILQQTYYGNSVLQYLFFLGSLIVGFIVLKLLQVLIMSHFKKFAATTETTSDDFLVKLIKAIGFPVAYLFVLFVSLKALVISDVFTKVIQAATVAIATFYVTRFVLLLIDYGFGCYLRRKDSSNSLSRSLAGIIRVIKMIIWALALCFYLDNLGFEISTVIAGLGIGGIAVALAAQAMLGDMFSYFSILFDRPFEVGDFIIVDDFLGTVERIGIKTTRISSLGGEQIIFGNSNLTSSRIRNYKRMQKRRVVFQFGVTYQTTSDQCREIPQIVRDIVAHVEHADLDRVHFAKFGDSSLIYEVVYYVDCCDYNLYMDCQQAINFALKNELEKRTIDFAYPTQTLYVSKIS